MTILGAKINPLDMTRCSESNRKIGKCRKDFPLHCQNLKRANVFFWSAPVAFRRVALETPEWTSRDSNHHRQSVSAGKTNAIPTEPSGRLFEACKRATFSAQETEPIYFLIHTSESCTFAVCFFFISFW